MSRPIFREHVRRSGEPKVAYATKEKALARCPLNQSAHLCQLCGHWHRHSISTPRKAGT